MTNKNADSSQVSSGNVPPPSGASPPAEGNDQPEQPNSRGGNKVYKSGPLFLSSRGIGWTSWKKRWFILTRTSLVFFRSDPNAAPPKGSEVNLTLGGIDLNSSGSVVVKADKKLLTVLFPDGRDGRAFTLKAETSEDLLEWKAALEEALASAPSAANGAGQNGVGKNDQPEAVDTPTEESKDKQMPKSLVVGRPILLALEDIDGTPSFLEKALRFIEEHGVKVEGILRQAADVDDVERQIREFEQGKKDFSPNEDPHVIADCVKYILRELPSSPVPASCCNALLEACRTERSKRIAAMRTAICDTFPEPNRRLLQRILVMMQTVVSHKTVNRMSTSAVAACMSPLLLRPLLAGECELEHDFDMGGDGSVQLLQAAAAANHAQAIVITLLEEYNKFFGDGSTTSGLYSDSEESGSESEELSDDESFEDDEEDDATEGSYSESYEGSEHASSGTCTATGDSEDDISEEKDDQSPEEDDNHEADLKQSADSLKNSSGKLGVKGSEHVLGHSNSVQANVSSEQSHEYIEESSPKHELTNQSAPTCIQKSATVSNGPGKSIKRTGRWGRTPGKKNLSMESIDISPEDEDMEEVERLEATKAELQNKIEEEAQANAVLYENLEKHKIFLHEQRVALEQDVERLQEQLQKEQDLRAALEAGVKMSEGGLPPSLGITDKVKAELEEISVAKADVNKLRQRADELKSQLNQQSEQNCCMMSDRPHLPQQSSNHQDKLKDKHKDAAASTKRGSEKSTWNKDQSNKTDVEKDVKQSDPVHNTKSVSAGSKADDEKDTKHESSTTVSTHSSHSDPGRSSKYSGHPPTSPSKDTTTGKPTAASSKRHSSRSEGAASTTNALSKLTNRLNFLKERRTQITSEIQNHDKGRSQGQPAPNSEGRSSEKTKGSDHAVQNSDKGASPEGSSAQNMDRDWRSDVQGGPNLERGKSENMDKARNVAPARTLSR